MDNFTDVFNETVRLAKKNLVMKIRSGNNMFFITPTHREPSIEDWKKQEALLHEFNVIKNKSNTNCISLYDE